MTSNNKDFRPNMLVFGNCQMRVIYEGLIKYFTLASIDINVVHFNDVHELTNTDIYQIRDFAGKCDIFITQIVKSEDYGINTQDIFALLKSSAVIIKLPSMYFNGYWPHHMDLFVNPDSNFPAVTDAVLYTLIEKKIPMHSIRSYYIDIMSMYSIDLFFQCFDESLNNLLVREKEADVDISLVDYLKQHARSEMCFYTINHPKKIVFDYFLENIIKILAKNISKLNGNLIAWKEILYDMSSIDFIVYPPDSKIIEFLKMPVSSKHDAFRFAKGRFSNEPYTFIKMEDEAKNLSDRVDGVDQDKRCSNLRRIYENKYIPISSL